MTKAEYDWMMDIYKKVLEMQSNPAALQAWLEANLSNEELEKYNRLSQEFIDANSK